MPSRSLPSPTSVTRSVSSSIRKLSSIITYRFHRLRRIRSANASRYSRSFITNFNLIASSSRSAPPSVLRLRRQSARVAFAAPPLCAPTVPQKKFPFSTHLLSSGLLLNRKGAFVNFGFLGVHGIRCGCRN